MQMGHTDLDILWLGLWPLTPINTAIGGRAKEILPSLVSLACFAAELDCGQIYWRHRSTSRYWWIGLHWDQCVGLNAFDVSATWLNSLTARGVWTKGVYISPSFICVRCDGRKIHPSHHCVLRNLSTGCKNSLAVNVLNNSAIILCDWLPVLKIIWYSTGIESTLNTFDFRRLDQLCISTAVFWAPQPPQLGGAELTRGAKEWKQNIENF